VPEIDTAPTFNIDQREVFTNILTRIARGITTRIKVAQPKELFRNMFMVSFSIVPLMKYQDWYSSFNYYLG
jgi:hypothetical protein